METKVCSICGEKKELSEFYTQKKHSKKCGDWIYYNPECKECTLKRSMKWGLNNRDKKLKSNLIYQKTKKGKLAHKRANEAVRKRGKRKEWEVKNKDKLKKYGLERANKNHEITNNEWENCKNYFNYRCAYCGMAIEEHYIQYNGELRLSDFHKEHVEHDGANDLSNCIPSCRDCNIRKWQFTLEEWYNENNDIFSQDRLDKIHRWLNEDYNKYIDLSKYSLERTEVVYTTEEVNKIIK